MRTNYRSVLLWAGVLLGIASGLMFFYAVIAPNRVVCFAPVVAVVAVVFLSVGLRSGSDRVSIPIEQQSEHSGGMARSPVGWIAMGIAVLVVLLYIAFVVLSMWGPGA